MKIIKYCSECGKEFLVYPSWNRSSSFCSRDCYMTARISGRFYQSGFKKGHPNFRTPEGTERAAAVRRGHKRESCWCGASHNFGGGKKGVCPKWTKPTGNWQHALIYKDARMPYTKYQRKLFELVRLAFPEAVLEFPIRTKRTTRFADVAIPSLKIDFEYDGEQHKLNPFKDVERDIELAEVGWTTVRTDYQDYRRWIAGADGHN